MMRAPPCTILGKSRHGVDLAVNLRLACSHISIGRPSRSWIRFSSAQQLSDRIGQAAECEERSVRYWARVLSPSQTDFLQNQNILPCQNGNLAALTADLSNMAGIAAPGVKRERIRPGTPDCQAAILPIGKRAWRTVRCWPARCARVGYGLTPVQPAVFKHAGKTSAGHRRVLAFAVEVAIVRFGAPRRLPTIRPVTSLSANR